MASFNYTTVEGDRIDLLAASFTAAWTVSPSYRTPTRSCHLRRFFRWARCW